MTSLMNSLSLCLLVLWSLVTRARGDFVEPPPDHSMLCVAEEQTTLPCRYQVDPGDTLVQVTWYKEKADGTKEPITTAHHTDGQTAFGSWSNHVRFRSNEPTVDSSLLILNTEVSNEGKYTCHISTFPSGNFERQMTLTVRTLPITNLDVVVLTEGQDFRVAATCRSVARPPPRLSWDTELNGKSTNRTSEGGSVSTQFSLHPLRSMNGKKLDCLVWHPTQDGAPLRLSKKLVVHYPPDADVTGFSNKWYVGLERAALRCVSRGNPTPQSFIWAREGKDLPEGVIPHPNGTLEFGRPLSLADAGVYKCEAKNEVGVGRAEVEVTVAELPPRKEELVMDSLMIIIIVAAAGGLLLVMLVIVIAVTCHHRRKNKKLTRELTEKREEISTLSRQTSFRRINSVSTDARGVTEENIPLRVEGTLRTSLSSLGEQARCRDSRSTLSCGHGGGGGGPMLDYLGRPVIHNGSRRGRNRAMEREEESRLRVESYVRNSTMSLQENRLHPPLMPTPFPVVHSTELLRPLNGSPLLPMMEGGVLLRPGSRGSSINGRSQQQGSPLSCTYPPVMDDEEDDVDDDEEDEGLGGLTSPASLQGGRADDQHSDTNSQVSDALSPRFQPAPSNGTLRPKPRPSPVAVSPHASLIHKAQIV